MDSSVSNGVDIFGIYRRYCDIVSGTHAYGGEGCRPDDELHKAKFLREALAELKFVESRLHARMSVLDEVFKLMLKLDFMVDFSEFSRFYDFVFFVCRENGQKNITVSKAVMAWKLVLAGRFRLLNQWCDFVEKNQRHNISEDTWRQVLAFGRCVNENLEGYDPEGAWPVLIDDFVDHMYRLAGSNDAPNLLCNCCDSEAQQFEDPLTGLRVLPGLKRKSCEDIECEEVKTADGSVSSNMIISSKRRHTHFADNFFDWGENLSGDATDDCMDIVKHNNQLGCSTSPCAVEGCLSRGFAGLLSSRSSLQFDRRRRVSYA